VPINYPTAGGLTPHQHSSDDDGGKLSAKHTIFAGFNGDRRVSQFGS